MNIIDIDLSKCVGCNSCVRVCPAPGANVAKYDETGKMIIDIDGDRCIKCGACIKACMHSARFFCDDTEEFINDMKHGKRIVVIAAPAIKIAFDGYWRHALQWLRNNGVSEIFDVSLGADICTWAHLRYLDENKGKKIISQPCAAIVNYILHHKSQLIKNLSPVQSPMTCLAIYIKKYLKYNCKIAALSPCIAKKEEFLETGYIDYNVTFEHLKDYFKRNNITLSGVQSFSEFEFDDKPGFVGAIYPKPGGLKENILIHSPNTYVINSEGIGKVYKDLNDYIDEDAKNLPDVFDVLNCEFGCNDGPAIGQEYKSFRLASIMKEVQNYVIQKRIENVDVNAVENEESDAEFREFDEKLDWHEFTRVYVPKQKREMWVTADELEQSFNLLGKSTFQERNFDCHACGYASCKEMAEAIALKINIPDNCHQFTLAKIRTERQNVEKVNNTIIEITEQLRNVVVSLNKSVENTRKDSEKIGRLGEKNIEDMLVIGEHMKELTKLGDEINNSINGIKKDARNYKEITDSVSEISQNINLLSFNASIEAARAGEHGKGFAVIASSIRELSENSRKSVQSANDNNKNIGEAITNIISVIKELEKRIKKLVNIIDSTIEDVKDTSENNKLISESMLDVKGLSENVNALIDRANEVLQKN